MAPRKRKPENAWLDAYPGLEPRHDGVFQLKHPVTGVKTGLGTKDRTIAIRAWQRFMPGWIAERNDLKAERLLSKLNNQEEIDQRGMNITLAEFSRQYRENDLPHSKKASGEPLAERTIKDYGNIIRRYIECSPLLQFPIADTYADIKIRRFLDQWSNNNRSYNYHRSILSIIYGRAVESGTVRKNPAVDIKPKPKPQRLVYLDDAAYSAITVDLMTHSYFGEEHDGEWRARICDILLFSACRPSDAVALEDAWFDENGLLTYRASKNKFLLEVEDATGALAETVLWLRQFKRQQGKISKYLCTYPRYMGIKMFRQEHVHAREISRMWAASVVSAGYEKGQFQFKDIRKKSLADDPGQNKGGHSEAMQKYYEKVVERAHRVKNNLTNPRKIDRQ